MNDILDKKPIEEIERHRSNIYRADLVNRSCKVNSDSFFTLDNPITDQTIFNVPINKFSGFEGHYYNESDPLVKTAQQLISNPRLKLIESYLFEYYKNFQPKTYGDLYRLSQANKLHKLPQTAFFHPWIHLEPTNIFRQGLFGPKDITNVQHRILRLHNLVNNIREFGYVPSEADIIEGYILLREDDFRFLITGGHHRVAVMYALHISKVINLESVLVKYEQVRSNIKIVKLCESKNWPGVKSGFLKKSHAEEMFNSYFI